MIRSRVLPFSLFLFLFILPFALAENYTVNWENSFNYLGSELPSYQQNEFLGLSYNDTGYISYLHDFINGNPGPDAISRIRTLTASSPYISTRFLFYNVSRANRYFIQSYILDPVLQITTNDIIQIQANISKSGTSGIRPILTLKGYSKNCLEQFYLESSYAGDTFNCNNTVFNKSFITTTSNVLKAYNFTPTINSTVYYLDFVFALASDALYNASVDYIKFINIETTPKNNNLPIGNISINDTLCYNTTWLNETYTAKLNLQLTDNENDNIFYAVKSPDIDNWFIEKFVTFQSGYYEPNYNILKLFKVVNGSGSTPCIDAVCLAAFDLNIYNLAGLPVYTVKSLPYLDAGSGFIRNSVDLVMPKGVDITYKTDKAMQGNSTIRLNLRLPKNELNLDYNLYSTSENMFNLSFYRYNSTRLYTYYNGALIWNTSTPQENYFYIQAFNDAANKRLRLTFQDPQSSPTNLDYNITFTSIQYPNLLRFTSGYPNSDLAYNQLNEILLLTTESYFNQSWTAYSSNLIDVTLNPSSTKLTAYVTDSYHKDLDQYKEFTTSYLFQSCDYVKPITYPDIISNNTFRPDKIINDIFGSSFRQYFVDNGTLDLAYSFLWVLFLFFFVIFLWGSYKATGSLNLSIALVLSSVCCLIFAIFLRSILHITTFLVLLALGLAKPVMEHIIPNG